MSEPLRNRFQTTPPPLGAHLSLLEMQDLEIKRHTVRKMEEDAKRAVQAEKRAQEEHNAEMRALEKSPVSATNPKNQAFCCIELPWLPRFFSLHNNP